MSSTAPQPAPPSSAAAAPAADNPLPTPQTSFNSLPVELKAVVVDQVDRMMQCEAASVWEWQEALYSLSLVNRELHALCVPHVWEALRLMNRPNSSYLRLVLRALPRYARHIKTLCLRGEEGDNDWRKEGSKKPRSSNPSWSLYDRYEDARRTRVLDEALELADIPDAEFEGYLGSDDTRSVLNVAVLKRCPGVRTLEWQHIDEEMEEEIRPSLQLFLRALTSTIGPSITSLRLVNSCEAPFHQLAAFLQACPNVEKLDVDIFRTEPNDPDLLLFNSAVANLTHLTSLTLEGDHGADSSLFLLPFASRLTSLDIFNRDGTYPLDFTAFRTFCAESGSALKDLFMDAVFDSVPYSDFEPLPLPSLTRLAWRDGSGSELDHFLSSPLTRIEIHHDNFPNGAPHLVRDLKKHSATLKELFIAARARRDPSIEVEVTTYEPEDLDDEPEYEDDGWGISDETVEAIRAWGAEAGVEVEVQERKDWKASVASPPVQEEEEEEEEEDSDDSLAREDRWDLDDSDDVLSD
ncbi:hypothetical protein JCM6882_004761 [Rhodosporidiobolus microsporus]